MAYGTIASEVVTHRILLQRCCSLNMEYTMGQPLKRPFHNNLEKCTVVNHLHTVTVPVTTSNKEATSGEITSIAFPLNVTKVVRSMITKPPIPTLLLYKSRSIFTCLETVSRISMAT